MSQQISPAADSQQALSQTLRTLSLREQIIILLEASRAFSARERAALLRAAGFSLLKDRFLPFFVHLLLTRLLAGAIWGFLCGAAAVLALFLLALVDHINSWADGPVIVALVSFLVAFICFSLFTFCRDIIRLFRRTCSREELQRLQIALKGLDDATRIALLRGLAGSISHSLPGESPISTLLSSLLLFGTAMLLVVLLVILAFPLHQLGQWPWILFVGLVAFVLGLQMPRAIQRFLKTCGIE